MIIIRTNHIGQFGNTIILHDIFFEGYYSTREIYLNGMTYVRHPRSTNIEEDLNKIEGERIEYRYTENQCPEISTSANAFNKIPYSKKMAYLISLGADNE